MTEEPRPVPAARSRLQSTLTLLGTFLLLGLLLRLVLWWAFGKQAGIALTTLPLMFSSGALADARVGLILLAPLALWSAFVPSRWRQSALYSRARAAALLLLNAGLVYTVFTEYFFFEEFSARFNLVAVDYLLYPEEVLGNIRDSYPVLPVLAVTVAIAAVLTAAQMAAPRAGRRTALAVLGCALVLSIAMPSMVAPGPNRIEQEIASNGLALFVEALRTHDLDYSDHYRTMDGPSAAALIREELRGQPDSGGRDTLRQTHPPRRNGLGRMNVVVVVEESLGCEFVGACGDSRGLTPSLDGLAKEGLFFEQVWATGTRTVRGLEAITASFPPIPSESVVKRPGGDRLDNWGRIMRAAGYQTSFLYGGYSYFDGMTDFFASNGFDLLDRRDFSNPRFSNIWGVSDEDLFSNALRHFDERAASGQNFFSVVLSTSNHKPFTFRAGVPGVPEHGGGREAGIRYADFALGEFIQEARGHSWFRDTLFVIVADHGARVYGREEIPMETYRIPLVFYAPAKLEPRRFAAPMSQMDVAPTVLGLLGLGYTGELFGRDVLNGPTANPTILLSHNHNVARFNGETLVVLGLKKSVREYRYDITSNMQTAVPVDADDQTKAVAWYQTAASVLEAHRAQ